MKKTSLLLLFLALACVAFSQKTTVEIGPEIKVDKNVSFWGHLHSNPTGHYIMLMENNASLFSRGKVAPIVQKYDRKFNLVFSKEINVDDSDIIFGNMLYAKDKFLFCTKLYDRSEKKLTCSVTQMDMAGKLSKPEKVMTIQHKEKNDEPNYVNWKISEDTSKVVLTTIADDNDDDLNVKVSLTVMDNNLTKLWTKGISLPYTQEQVSVRSVTVSNDGQVYLLAKVYDERRSKETKKKDGKKKPAYKMIIFMFNSETDKKPKEYVLGLQDKFVTDITFKLSPKNDLICSGFYANDTKGVIQGVFFTRINGETGTVEVANKKEISDKDLANLDTEKDRSGNEGLDSEFNFNQIITKEDGGIYAIAEEAYSYTYTTRQGNNWVTHTRYINNEIFVSSIGPSGTIDWVRVIPKKQIFTDISMFNGYSHMYSGGKLYFLYNDDEDNIERPLTAKAKRISSFRDAVSSLVTIEENGKMNRKKIFDAKDDADALMVASDSRQISPNELFFVTTRFKLLSKTRLRMGLVRIK